MIPPHSPRVEARPARPGESLQTLELLLVSCGRSCASIDTFDIC